MSTAHAPRPRAPRRRGRTVATAAVVAAATALSGALAASAAISPAPSSTSPAASFAGSGALASSSAATGTSTGEVTMIHANIKSSLSVERFQADVRKVLSGRPDFVTYNEVPLRVDSVLAPDGYDIHRSKKNRYTAAAPVVWRTDRWTLVDSGTFRISNYREIPRGRNIRLGLRFANWVTLSSGERQVSVVSTHVAPLDKNMPDLLRPSVRRIGALVEQLAPQGPVLVGGDFNVHYKSGRYPRDLLTEAGMAPTYDTLQSYFATGDHQGATIDYVFNRGADNLAAQQHRPMELRSDHDAVVAGLGWLRDAPSDTQRINSDPAGDSDARRLAVAALARAVEATEPGQSLDVVGTGLTLRVVFRRLRAAVQRGVEVDYLTRSPDLTRRERRLARVVETAGGESSVAQCRDECARAWRQENMARTFVMVRDLDGRAVQRIDANRVLNPAMLQLRTRLVVRTGQIGLAEGEKMLTALR